MCIDRFDVSDHNDRIQIYVATLPDQSLNEAEIEREVI